MLSEETCNLLKFGMLRTDDLPLAKISS